MNYKYTQQEEAQPAKAVELTRPETLDVYYLWRSNCNLHENNLLRSIYSGDERQGLGRFGIFLIFDSSPVDIFQFFFDS